MSELEVLESNIDRQKNELAVLKSIYGDELRDLRTNKQKKQWQPLDISITLTPQTGMSGPSPVYAKIDLRVICGEEYPEEVPQLQVQNTQGLSHQDIAILVSEIEALSKKLRGEVMIFELAQHVRKFLCEHNKPGFNSFYEEMMLRKQEKIQYEMQEKQMKEDKERQVLQNEIQKRQEVLKAELRNRRESARLSLDSEQLSRSIPSSPRERVRTNSRRRYFSTSESFESTNCEHRGTKLIHFDSNKGERQVHRGKCLGHSAKGSVVYAALDMTTGELLAVTEWTLKYTSREKSDGAGNLKDLQHITKQIATIEQELNHLYKLHHPNLVHYLNMKSIAEEDCIIIYILQEFVVGTTCSLFFVDNNPVPIDKLRHLATGILSALNYLHENNVVHKDIRDSCVHIDRFGGIKLSDYSLDKRLADVYQASCLAKTEDDFPTIQGRSGKKLDVYRFGILLLSLLKGYIVSEKELDLDLTIQANLKDFLSKCLVKDERNRWSTEQLLEHSFIRTPLDRRLSASRQNQEKEEDDSDSEEPLTAVHIHPLASGGHSRIQIEFEALKWLGKGAFGDVLKVKNKLDGCIYAIKRIKLNPKNIQLNKKITREVKLLSRLQHENVVRYYNSWIESATLDEGSLYSDSTPTGTPVNMPSEENTKEVVDQTGSEDIEKLAPPIHDVEWNVSYESRLSSRLSEDSEEDETDDSSDGDEDWALFFQESSEGSKWLNGLFQQRKDGFLLFQAIAMLDGKAENHQLSKIANIIVQEVSSEIPSRVINFLEEDPRQFRSSVASRSIHQSTLFITIQVEKTNPKIPLEFLMEVSRSSSHPRCLMIILLDGKSVNREELLRFGWSKNFLDLTILEVLMETDSDRNQIWDHQQVIAMIHDFNPFSQSYSRNRYLIGNPIFQYKLHDLKRVEMKAASYDSPPFLSVKRNLSGHVLEVSGTSANLCKVVSKVLNFRISNVPQKNNLLGNSSCEKSKTSGLISQLVRNEIQFLHTELALVSLCREYSFTVAFSDQRCQYILLVPILKSTKMELSSTKSSFYMGLLTCFLVACIWLILVLLGFDNRFWCLLHLVEMLLGVPVPRDVTKVSDRIALLFILIGFWLFSSTFYSILTDIKSKEKTEEKLNTLMDLNTSNIQLLMPNLLRNILLRNKNNEILQALLKKSGEYSTTDECIQLLLKWKNVSCIMAEPVMKMSLQKHFNESVTPAMKILKESLLEAPQAIFLECNSPYVFEFEQTLRKVAQSGLVVKWNQQFIPDVIRRSSLELEFMEDSADLLFNLLLILVAGYAISIVAFLGELVVNLLEKRFHCKIAFW